MLPFHLMEAKSPGVLLEELVATFTRQSTAERLGRNGLMERSIFAASHLQPMEASLLQRSHMAAAFGYRAILAAPGRTRVRLHGSGLLLQCPQTVRRLRSV